MLVYELLEVRLPAQLLSHAPLLSYPQQNPIWDAELYVLFETNVRQAGFAVVTELILEDCVNFIYDQSQVGKGAPVAEMRLTLSLNYAWKLPPQPPQDFHTDHNI